MKDAVEPKVMVLCTWYMNKYVRLFDVLLSSIKYIVNWLCCFICQMLQTSVV